MGCKRGPKPTQIPNPSRTCMTLALLSSFARITKKFCQFLAGHPFVPRPEALVRAGLLKQLDAGMMPPAPPLLQSAQRPPAPGASFLSRAGPHGDHDHDVLVDVL